MPNTLTRFLVVHHLKYYALMFAFLAMVAVVTIRTANTAFVILLPLSLISSLSVTAIVFELGFRREIETLQAYGVSLRAIATPPIVVTAIPMAAGCITVAFAKDVAFAVWFGIAAIAGLATYFAVLFAGIRTHGNANTGRTCMRATLAQIAVVATGILALVES
jgi:hypothetical protein